MPKYLLLSFGRTSATLEKPGRLGGRGEGGRREGGRGNKASYWHRFCRKALS